MFSSYMDKLHPVFKEWNKISLLYSMEPLMRLPVEIYCIKPHSYKSLGAQAGATFPPGPCDLYLYRGGIGGG